MAWYHQPTRQYLDIQWNLRVTWSLLEAWSGLFYGYFCKNNNCVIKMFIYILKLNLQNNCLRGQHNCNNSTIYCAVKCVMCYSINVYNAATAIELCLYAKLRSVIGKTLLHHKKLSFITFVWGCITIKSFLIMRKIVYWISLNQQCFPSCWKLDTCGPFY